MPGHGSWSLGAHPHQATLSDWSIPNANWVLDIDVQRCFDPLAESCVA